MESSDLHHPPASYPVAVQVPAATEGRNRLTTAFRFFLALPHLILVGGPVVAMVSTEWTTDSGVHIGWGSAGILGAVVMLVAVLVWFAILITGAYPKALWPLTSFYLRWRVRAIAYMTLLRDEYPPFGDGAYPADLELPTPDGRRDRLSVAFRWLLALPHLIVLALLSVAWSFATAVAWALILITGRYPEQLYGFSLGVFAWSIRVEAYLLLVCDDYPPFTLRA